MHNNTQSQQSSRKASNRNALVELSKMQDTFVNFYFGQKCALNQNLVDLHTRQKDKIGVYRQLMG